VLPCLCAAPELLRVRGGKGGTTTPPSMQLGGLFGFGKKEEEGGKFERQGNLQGMGQKGFGPLGVSLSLSLSLSLTYSLTHSTYIYLYQYPDAQTQT
jgi:hypothetical protein